MGYFVSRQHYYYSEITVVEIETGGLDYAGPDMVGFAYEKLGEGKEFDNPVDAVDSAIAIRDRWRADGTEVDGISFGTSGGFGMEGEPFPGTDEMLRAKAEKICEAMPHCDQCGDVLKEGEIYQVYEFPLDERFCSDYCCERYIANNFEIEEIENND